MNNIKIKDKIIENIVIDDIIIKNSNNNIVKFNISLSNNTISFKNCTDKFEEKKKVIIIQIELKLFLRWVLKIIILSIRLIKLKRIGIFKEL